MATSIREKTGNAAIKIPLKEALGKEFIATRVLDAPRGRVFKAWTDPAQVSQWWGPLGFTIPFCEMNVEQGGSYRIVMRSLEGVDYPITGIYREIVEPARLIYTDNWEEHPDAWWRLLRKNGADNTAPEALNTVTFEESDNKTLLIVRKVFGSAAARDAMVKIGMKEGWSESLDRLAGFLKLTKETAMTEHLPEHS
jgi:uncharacterized protein YndB with AHSA1/START domain